MLKKICLCFCLLSGLFAFGQTDIPSGQYSIVPEESQIEIKTGSSGLLGFAGHPHAIVPANFSGGVVFQPGETNGPKVTVRIESASLKETGDFDAKDKEEIESQMHTTALESAKYPEITFQSTQVKYSEGLGHVYDAQIEGDLNLHGITRKIAVPARITTDGDTMRATGSFKIERPDYKIETKSAGGGTVKVAKTIDINFTFVLKRLP